MKSIENLKKRLSQKYKGSRLDSFARHVRALYLYYKHVWRLSSAHAWLNSFFKALWQEIQKFNLLNYIFAFLAFVLEKLSFKNAAERVRFCMQEKDIRNGGIPGVNRHVIVRYLFKELFLYFFIAFLFFFMIFFVNQILLVAENILKKHVPIVDVMRLITYSLPMVIAQSAPFATLVGFLMCLGRLATDNEVLILRASGLGYKMILVPVVLLGIVISIASFFVNDYLLPLGTLKYNRLYRTILTSNPAVELESNSVKRTSDKTLVIGQVDGDDVSDLIFFDTDSDGKPRIIVSDKSVVKKAEEPGVLMKLLMNNSSVIFFDNSEKKTYDFMLSENMEMNIFESSLGNVNRKTSPREMTSYDLYKKIQKMKDDDSVTKKSMNQHKLELNKKFSMPFGSFFFAILALPLALLFGKHNGQTIGLIFGLFISVLYWAVSIVGQIFSSRSGNFGVVTMWIPDFIIGLLGLLFFIRLLRR
ncbi:MAG: LptF/LptG family permease [Treponema sp.]|nr:LptF/LptG family permease [Treponema sp.]